MAQAITLKQRWGLLMAQAITLKQRWEFLMAQAITLKQRWRVFMAQAITLKQRCGLLMAQARHRPSGWPVKAGANPERVRPAHGVQDWKTMNALNTPGAPGVDAPTVPWPSLVSDGQGWMLPI